MAMMDYGAIAFKNGKLISKEMFTPMIDMVGWEDTEKDVYESDCMKPIALKDNYFAYIGDKDCTIAFYKEQIVTVSRHSYGVFSYHHEFLNCTNYTWTKWTSDYLGTNLSNLSRAIVTKRNGYYVCKWRYKGDKYKVYFGYGVDLPYYKKWRIVNYYRSPRFNLYLIRHWFEDKIYNLKNFHHL